MGDIYSEQKALTKYIKDLVAIYNIDSKIFTPEIWFDLLTMPQGDCKNDSYIKILNLREKIRTEHLIKVERLKEINKQIYVDKITNLLDKIDKIIDT